MHLKGLVKFFTAALILISLYQLSITFIVRNEEKSMRARALRAAQSENPSLKGDDLTKLADKHYQDITDSMQGEVVFSIPMLKKYTYQDAKAEELNLGLDLQGGMNVTLEVSLDDLVRSMSNNPRDAALNKAIAEANATRANSDANFVTLFGQAFEKQNPNVSMAYLFTKPSEKEITLSSTNAQVLAKINKEAKEAVTRTFNVLQQRIDKFGVSNPNVNLDENKSIITVELAGVQNPERVRAYLQATAKLQFFECFGNQEIGPLLGAANDALYAHLSGTETTTEDTAAKATTGTDSTAKAAGADTASLSSLVANKKEPAAAATGDTSGAAKTNEAIKKNPIWALIRPNASEQDGFYPSPEIGFVLKRDTAKVNKYLALDVVKNKFPSNIKFLYGVQEDAKKVHDPNMPLALYAVKVPPGGNARLEGDHIIDARNDFSPMDGKPNVNMTMNMTGSRIWKDMTGRSVGGFVAVVLDDRVYSAPRVINEISTGTTEISGGFTPDRAKDLANILKSGKLPAPAHIVQEQVVGPTLGVENINKGMGSLALSFVVIFVLMLVYYNSGGIIANIALILNLLFTVGILSALHATLTMAGIAGLVLTVGMAVDTNVIIFERIKEELTLGKSYQQAINDGYNRSYAPVLDGHITVLITAIILFVFGLGPVKGFATTQIIGILLSLFCGILVSRLVTDVFTNKERHMKYFTAFSTKIFRKAHFKFVEARKVAYVISVIVLVAGIASFFVGFDQGVEFRGGRSYTIKFDQKVSTEDVREKMKKHFGEYPVVKTIGTNNQLNLTTSYLITQPGQGVEQQVQKKLYEGLVAEHLIPATVSQDDFVHKYIQSSQTVLPTISDDLKAGAVKATILALAAIFIYILVRFRKWQYSLGTMLALLHDVCVTLAVFAFFKGKVPFALEIDQHFIAAILTVIGFSMNDTVIVFDRIREYFRKSPDEDKKSVINRAINDTLSRTIMSSLTVFLTILILFIFGGEATRGFAFAMLIGVITGTYSSIFVAAPVLVDMDKSDKLSQEVDHEARIEELKKMA